MRIMPWRHEELERSLDGLNATDVPLVAISPDGFTAAGFTDNKGIFYFIPSIAKYFGVSLDQAIFVFFMFLVLTGTLIATLCFCKIFKHWSSRLSSILGIFLLALATGKIGHLDVYTAFFFAVTAIVPIFLLLHQKSSQFSPFLIGMLAFSGIVIGYSNFIRCHAGTGVLLFLMFWLALRQNLLKKEKIICFSVLIICSLIPYLHFNHLERNRDEFLIKYRPSYRKVESFPIWHLIYNGLGYLDNKYGLEYSDSNGMNAVKAVDPKVAYCSDKYYQILENQFFLIVKTDPWFVLKTVLVKIIVLCLKILLSANFGVLFYFYVKSPIKTIIPFIAAAGFYSLQGILVVPYDYYVLGMISIATMFGIYMIGLGLEKYLKINPAENEDVKPVLQ